MLALWYGDVGTYLVLTPKTQPRAQFSRLEVTYTNVNEPIGCLAHYQDPSWLLCDVTVATGLVVTEAHPVATAPSVVSLARAAPEDNWVPKKTLCLMVTQKHTGSG